MLRRVPQVVLIVSTVIGSWLGMQAVHELGHVAGAWATHGRVARVVLHPLTISRTDLAENPRPLVVVWAGPVIGSLLPLALWAATAKLRLRGTFLARFFAGFCLIANGAYIGGGSFTRAGDCGEMLRHGSPIWTLWLFGAATIPSGLLLWHGQGRHFGLGDADGQVDPDAVWIATALCGMLIALGLAVGGK
jgi:hypothetical protein